MRVLLALLALCSCGRIADVPDDAGTDAAAEGSTCSDDFGASARWSFFDVADVAPPKPGFVGGAYVGQHVYFSPGLNNQLSTGRVVRVSTTSAFTADSSWDTFDLATIDPKLTNFDGATSDTHAVYLLSASTPVVVRHDDTAPLAASWSAFDVSTIDAKASTFTGALAIDQSVIFFGSWFARYDASMSFDEPTAWRTMDLVGGCSGSAFDGRYAYFACAQFVHRYDTTLPINSPVPWSTYELPIPSSVEVATATFDGQFAYFASSNGTRIWRVDTKAKFDAEASWAFVDLQPILPASLTGFWDMRFDGRYIYASPDFDGSVIARFNTHESFTDLAAWKALDLLTLDTRARYFAGSAFDGRYVYLVPVNTGNHVAARYDTLPCAGD